VIKVVLPLVLLGLGIALVAFLVSTRPEPAREQPTERIVPVEVVVAERENLLALVEARGEVQPAEQVALEPEVAGRITWVSEDLVPGGTVRQGQLLLRLEAADYVLSVEAQRSEVSQAEVQLRQEQNRQEVSERAWERYRSRRETTPDADPGLALNRPQVRAAERALEAARSRLRQAELELARTTLRAPFNATIIEEQADVGRRVAPGQSVATLVGTDRYWVNVAVEVGDVSLLRVPGPGASGEGSPVRVSYAARGERTERRGRVLRLIKQLGPEGSMARVLVEVADPLGLRRGADPLEAGPPLLVGSFVDVVIEGKVLEGVVALPEQVLYEGRAVWVVDVEDRLRRQEVRILRQQQGRVLLAEGVEAGQRVVTSHLAVAVPGTKVRVEEPRAEGPVPAVPQDVPVQGP
jgi:RND family efflux transporter MFP subunit